VRLHRIHLRKKRVKPLNQSVDQLTGRSLTISPTTAILAAVACLLLGAALCVWTLGLILTQSS